MRFDQVSLLAAFGVTLGASFTGGVSSPAPGASSGNLPPQCVGDVPERVLCNGGPVSFTLDATASYDPENDPLTFFWMTGCPSAVIADPHAALTTMTVDTAQTCGSVCSLRLVVGDGTAFSFCRFFISFEELETGFSVSPGACPNTILIGGGDDDELLAATLPTSLLGSKAFDPMNVEQGSIQLSRASSSGFQGAFVLPIGFQLTDVGTPLDLEECECNPLPGDGIVDLLIEFDLQEVIQVLELDTEPDGTVVPLEITGLLVDGTLTFGIDCVVIEQGGGPICPDGVSVELWPPDHAYRALDLMAIAGVTDPGGLPFTIEITGITQDEPVNGTGDGDTVCDGTGIGTDVAFIRAERRNGGNGRVYRVEYTATNSAGASCDGAIEVTVPKSRNSGPAVDDGQLYDSTEGC